MDREEIREFCVRHVEKFIFPLVLVASGLLVYQGLQQEDILDSHQPSRLIADAHQVRAAIDQDRNDTVLRGRQLSFRIPQEIKPLPMGPPDYPLCPLPRDAYITRRQDPQLIAPQALQVQGVLAPMAMRSTDGKYALRDLPSADPVAVVSGPLPRGGRGAEQQLQKLFEMELGMEGEESYPGENLPLTDRAPIRRLQNPPGARPTPTRHVVTKELQPPVPGIGWFIAGTAVMPHRMLHQAYRDALASAEGYDPVGRDQPRYLSYELQRADVTVTSVDQLQPADWVKRDGRIECAKDAIVRWSGFAPEIVPADYREDTTLTMWIPPVMLTDYSTFCLHPLVPMRSQREIEAAQMDKRAEPALKPEEVAKKIIVVDGGQRDRDRDQQVVQIAGDFPPRRMLPRPVDYKLIRFYDFADDARDPNAPRPGRKYVYRVRVAVEDPNFPLDSVRQPSGRSLAPAVFDRFIRRAASVRNAKDPVRQRASEAQRWTDWSRPSAPISLPAPDQVYVGPIGQPQTQTVKVGDRIVELEVAAAKVNLAISRFSAKYASRVSMLMKEVTEGTVLSKQQDSVEVVDPITLKIKAAPASNITTDMTVIDIDGGRPLSIHQQQGLSEPSLLLLFDENGGLMVHEEVDDQQRYRAETFAE
jgi:hypothetical protein